MKPPKPKLFTRDIDDLPLRIVATLTKANLAEDFICGMKTDYKPNPSIPTIWLVCSKGRLLATNTHQRQGIFINPTWAEVNEVRRDGVKPGLIAVEVIYQKLGENDERYPIDAEVTLAEVDEFISCCKDAKSKT